MRVRYGGKKAFDRLKKCALKAFSISKARVEGDIGIYARSCDHPTVDSVYCVLCISIFTSSIVHDFQNRYFVFLGSRDFFMKYQESF